MHLMSTNFAITLVWKHEYDVKLWRHKQHAPNANNHHTTLNETPSRKFSAFATADKLLFTCGAISRRPHYCLQERISTTKTGSITSVQPIRKLVGGKLIS